MFSLEIENGGDDPSATLPDTQIIESFPGSPVLRRANANAHEVLGSLAREDFAPTGSLSLSSPDFFAPGRRQSSAPIPIAGAMPRSRAGSKDPVAFRRSATATAENVIVGDGAQKLLDPEEQFPMSMAPSSSFSPRGKGGRQ